MATKKRYTFQCPVCFKTFTNDEPGEPCCTGPSESRDDHWMEIMRLIKVEDMIANPVRAEERAAGKLLMPAGIEVPGYDAEKELERDALIVVSK